MTQKQAGAAIVIVGGLIFIAGLALLPYVSTDEISLTAWQLATKEPVAITTVAAGAVVFAAAALRSEGKLSPALALGCSFFVFARTLPVNLRFSFYNQLGAGLWLCLAMSVVMSVAAVIAILDSRADPNGSGG